MTNKLFLSMLSCIFASAAEAATWSSTNLTTVTTIYPATSATTSNYSGAWGIVYLQFAEHIDSAGCRTDNPGLVALFPAHPLYKEIYATLLAASISGKSIRYYIDGCDSAGWPILQNIQLN